MGFNDLPPGHKSLRPCPNCMKDAIYRTSDSWYSLTVKYYCDACGHETTKNEVAKSFGEMIREAKNDFEENVEKPQDEYKDGIRELEDNSQRESTEVEKHPDVVATGEKITPPDQPRINNDNLRKSVKNRQLEGWDVQEVDNKNKKVIMKSTKGGTVGGHALTGLTTGLWTFGAGNVVYDKLSKKRNVERIVLTADKDDQDNDQTNEKEDIAGQLRKLDELRKDEVITDDEFEEKKEELLQRY